MSLRGSPVKNKVESRMTTNFDYAKELFELTKENPFSPPNLYRPILDGVSSCHPAYSSEVGKAKKVIKAYLDDKARSQSPLNCLLLGPPGAGKTFVAKALGKALGNGSVFEEINLSLDSDAQTILKKIWGTKQRPRVVFLDEFDVTVDGSSVVRYLLDPITKKEHAKTIFIFSGSYLKNRAVLNTLCRNVADFDLLRFLFDVFMAQKDQPTADFVQQLHQMSGLYRETRQALSPNSDLLNYLRQLHKIRDFLSRINGFVVQIPDVSSPLAITDPMLVLHDKQQSAKEGDVILWKGKVLPEDVREFAQSRGRTHSRYKNAIQPLMAYKNMLLIERLGLVLALLPKPVWVDGEKQFGNADEQETDCPVFISRKLLNYLVMAPLEHNVRSLRFMMEHCLSRECIGSSSIGQTWTIEWNDGGGKRHIGRFNKAMELKLDSGNKMLFEMHVNKEPFFESPTALWTVLEAADCIESKDRGKDNEQIRVPYEAEWKAIVKRRADEFKDSSK